MSFKINARRSVPAQGANAPTGATPETSGRRMAPSEIAARVGQAPIDPKAIASAPRGTENQATFLQKAAALAGRFFKPAGTAAVLGAAFVLAGARGGIADTTDTTPPDVSTRRVVDDDARVSAVQEVLDGIDGQTVKDKVATIIDAISQGTPDEGVANLKAKLQHVPGDSIGAKLDHLGKKLGLPLDKLPGANDVEKIKLTRDLIARIPGDTTDAKVASLETIYGNIDGQTFKEKQKTVAGLIRLASGGTGDVDQQQDVLKILQGKYQILAELAGGDGYLNHGDIKAVLKSLDKQIDDEIWKEVNSRGVVARLYARANFDGIKKKVVAEIEKGMTDGLNQAGVTARAPDPDGRRDLKIATLKPLMEKLEASAGDALSSAGGVSVKLPMGIPIAKLKPLIEDGKIPVDLKISVNGNSVEIR